MSELFKAMAVENNCTETEMVVQHISLLLTVFLICLLLVHLAVQILSV